MGDILKEQLLVLCIIFLAGRQVPSEPKAYFFLQAKVKKNPVNGLEPLTNPSMHGDSLMAPQQPRKPTTIIRAPAAIRIYTPAEMKTWRLI